MSTRYLVLDTETTGLEPRLGHKIIEIGCVEIIGREITGKHYQQYLNPEREIDEGALDVHGIELADLLDKPNFAQIADEFLAYISGASLIIHNASFDIGFLNNELGLLSENKGCIEDYCEVVDTLLMARKMHPGQRNSLDALSQRHFVDNAHRTLHGALLDSEILAEVYLAMTGGQLNLLGEDPDADTETEGNVAPLVHDLNRAPICIIKPSEAALEAHEKWLSLLSEKSDEPIRW